MGELGGGHREGAVVTAARDDDDRKTRAVRTDRGTGSGCPLSSLTKASLLEPGSLGLHFLPHPLAEARAWCVFQSRKY